MKKYTLFLCIALFGACLTLSATPPDKAWFTDYSKAQAEAKKKNLPMFLLFTGSDWCGWCVKLKQETLTKSKFKSFTKDKVVLVYLDFPKRLKLPQATVTQNRELAKQYGIRGYPSIIITDAEGTNIGKLGYGALDDFMPKLEAMLKKANDLAPKPEEKKVEEKKEEPKKPEAVEAITYLTDFAEAKKLAAEKKLPIVALFTGSDWCGWCIKLKRETLGTQEFRDFIGKEAIFLYLDFPQKLKLSPELQKQNDELAQKYGVQGFPDTRVLDAEGKELGQISGFRSGTEYLRLIRSFMKK